MKQTEVRSAEPSGEPGDAAKVTREAGGNAPTQSASQRRLEPGPLEVPAILLEGDEPEVPPQADQLDKFALGRRDQPTATGAAPGELPASYGTGRLLLAAVDPGRLYAHWDLTEDQQKGCAAQSKEGELRVRVHRGDLGGPLEREIQVQPEAGHSFIAVGRATERYVAQLGCQRHDGTWQVLAASEPVVTPGELRGTEQSIQFGTLRFADLPGAGMEQAGPPARLRPEEHAPTQPQPPFTERRFPLPPPLRRIWAQSPAPIEAAGLEGTEAESATPPGSGVPIAKEHTSRHDLSSWLIAASSSEWTEAQERALTELIGRSLLRREWVGSAEIERLLRGESRLSLEGELASTEAALKEPALWSGALGAGLSVERRGFWLNVNAELVLYGGTEPDAKLTIGGQPVELRPDGTFSCRFALPDGVYPLAVSATSNAGEWLQAELDFSRTTRYSGPVGIHPQDPVLKPPMVPK